MDYEAIILKKQDGIATITLNRPEKLNAVNYQLIYDFQKVLDDLDRDDEARVLVITGAGRSFCAGADLGYSEIRSGEAQSWIMEDERIALVDIKEGRLLHRIQRTILTLTHYPKPTIAMVNGYAIGFGCDMALACDLRTGSPEASFNAGFIRFGAAHGTGGTWLLPRLVGTGRALEILLTGDFCGGEEAYRIGLLNRLAPKEDLERTTMELAGKLAKGAPIGLRLTKIEVYRGLEIDLETALHLATASETMTLHSEDIKEGIKAIAEKRSPVYQGR